MPAAARKITPADILSDREYDAPAQGSCAAKPDRR